MFWPLQPYVSPQDRFLSFDYPGKFYCSGYSTITNDEYIIAVEDVEKRERYYDGYDWKSRTVLHKKYVLYRISLVNGQLIGERCGGYKSYRDAIRIATSRFPNPLVTIPAPVSDFDDFAF